MRVVPQIISVVVSAFTLPTLLYGADLTSIPTEWELRFATKMTDARILVVWAEGTRMHGCAGPIESCREVRIEKLTDEKETLTGEAEGLLSALFVQAPFPERFEADRFRVIALDDRGQTSETLLEYYEARGIVNDPDFPKYKETSRLYIVDEPSRSLKPITGASFEGRSLTDFGGLANLALVRIPEETEGLSDERDTIP